jgi:hypothetical protein
MLEKLLSIWPFSLISQRLRANEEGPPLPFRREDLVAHVDRHSSVDIFEVAFDLSMDRLQIKAGGSVSIHAGATFICKDLDGPDGAMFVDGVFEGVAWVDLLTLSRRGVVNGFVRYHRLEIAQGGIFNGRLKSDV